MQEDYNNFMTDMQIVSIFKVAIQRIYPQAEIYFYGSRVNGLHAQDADYDVLVSLKTLSPKIRDKVYEIAWRIGLKHNALICPVVCEKKEFKLHAMSPFYRNVQKTGLRL
jgi:predicted nucleotidyltransferase